MNQDDQIFNNVDAYKNINSKNFKNSNNLDAFRKISSKNSQNKENLNSYYCFKQSFEVFEIGGLKYSSYTTFEKDVEIIFSLLKYTSIKLNSFTPLESK